MPDKDESPVATAELLREILKWQRFECFPKLRKLLLDSLKTDQEKLVYENTDGEKSSYDITKETGVPISTVKNWWNKWYDQGILQPSGKRKGRPQKIMALEDMGIETPKLSPPLKTCQKDSVVSKPEPNASDLKQQKDDTIE